MKKNNPNCYRTLIFDEDGIKEFARTLRIIRIREGLTQSQLAFESGLSLSQVARIETSRINPTICTIFALARALNVQLPELFNFQLKPNDKQTDGLPLEQANNEKDCLMSYKTQV